MRKKQFGNCNNNKKKTLWVNIDTEADVSALPKTKTLHTLVAKLRVLR